MELLKTNKRTYRIILIVIALVMVIMSLNHGITGDEDDASAYGKAIISYMTTLGDDTTALHMPEALDKDHILHLYGGAFDMMTGVAHKILPFINEFTLRHILNALMGFLGIFFAGRIILLFSNYRAAIIVSLLMFSFPFFLGHSMNNPKDVPFAAANIMSIYFIIRFWQAYPNAKKKDYAYLILSIALALNIRIAALLLFAYSGLWMLMSIMPNWKEGLKKLVSIKSALIFAGLCIASYSIAVLFWPFALQDPINNPFVALDTFSNLQISLAQTWEGLRVRSAELPWYYIPKSILITSTYLFLIGLVMAAVFIYAKRKDKKIWLILFVAFTGFFPVAYVVIKDANVFHLWRHILFVFPSLAIIAAFGWESLIANFENHKNKFLKVAPLILFVAFMLEPLIFIAKTQPNEVNYFNAFVGGPKKAYQEYEFDYYYNGLKPSIDYFIDNVAKKLKPTDSIIVTTNASHLLACYLVDYPNVRVEYNRYYELNEAQWDYNILHKALVPQAKLNSGSWLPEKHTLYTATMLDLPLSAVIKRPSTENLKASQLFKQGQFAEAIIAYKAYLKEDPINIGMQKALAKAYMQNQQNDEAYELIKNVQTKEPDDLEAKQILGILSLQKNDPNTAIQMFSQIIQANPQYLNAYYYLGNAQQNLGQFNEALKSYNMASRVPQLTNSCYKAMGDIYKHLGNEEQAQKLYNLMQNIPAQ